MRLGWGLSGFGHVAFIVAGLIVWPRTPPQIAEASVIVPIDVVTISEKTNITAISPPAPVIAPDLDPAKEGAQQPVPEEAAPEPAEALPDKEAKPLPKKPDKPKPKALDLDQLALLVDRSKKDIGRRDPSAQSMLKPEDSKPRRGIGEQNALTASEEDALRAQMAKCWRAPVDMPHPEQLVVKVRISLTQSGALEGQPQLVSPATLIGAPAPLVIAAQNAIRAVRLCVPYQLPAEKYDRWREIVMTFDPRDMMN